MEVQDKVESGDSAAEQKTVMSVDNVTNTDGTAPPEIPDDDDELISTTFQTTNNTPAVSVVSQQPTQISSTETSATEMKATEDELPEIIATSQPTKDVTPLTSASPSADNAASADMVVQPIEPLVINSTDETATSAKDVSPSTTDQPTSVLSAVEENVSVDPQTETDAVPFTDTTDKQPSPATAEDATVKPTSLHSTTETDAVPFVEDEAQPIVSTAPEGGTTEPSQAEPHASLTETDAASFVPSNPTDETLRSDTNISQLVANQALDINPKTLLSDAGSELDTSSLLANVQTTNNMQPITPMQPTVTSAQNHLQSLNSIQHLSDGDTSSLLTGGAGMVDDTDLLPSLSMNIDDTFSKLDELETHNSMEEPLEAMDVDLIDPESVLGGNDDEMGLDDLPNPSEMSIENVNDYGSHDIEQAEKRYSFEDKRDSSKKGSFSLGIPGLAFSAQNVRVASDGTKMVQIHQSQITPSQLQALQSNPNIKVVFRHIPSGKSFTKPPKNLFHNLGKPAGGGGKRKLTEATQQEDDSIYNFDDDFGAEFDLASTSPTKMPKEDGASSKPGYARYNPNVGMKKRRPGRPRTIPDPMLINDGMTSKMKNPVFPQQIMLTDALAKLNKASAKFVVKVHISQVTHDILTNMELSPEYNVMLTTKHEVPAEQSLEELVKEWEEKEKTDAEIAEQEKEVENVDNNDAVSISEPSISPPEPVVEELPVQQPDPIVLAAQLEAERKAQEEAKRRKEERAREREQQKRDEKLAAEQARLKREQREREQAEILSSALQVQTSRTGRIRKPSRHSLAIAQLTKNVQLKGRKGGSTSFSPDDKPTFAAPKSPAMKRPLPTSPDDSAMPASKKSRGRPRKRAGDMTSPERTGLTPSSVTSSPVRPRVMLSTIDKEKADSFLHKSMPECSVNLLAANSLSPRKSGEKASKEASSQEVPVVKMEIPEDDAVMLSGANSDDEQLAQLSKQQTSTKPAEGVKTSSTAPEAANDDSTALPVPESSESKVDEPSVESSKDKPQEESMGGAGEDAADPAKSADDVKEVTSSAALSEVPKVEASQLQAQESDAFPSKESGKESSEVSEEQSKQSEETSKESSQAGVKETSESASKEESSELPMMNGPSEIPSLDEPEPMDDLPQVEESADPTPQVESTDTKPQVESTDNPQVESTDTPQVESTETPQVESTDTPQVESTDKPQVESTDKPQVESTETPSESTDTPSEEATTKPTSDKTSLEETSNKAAEPVETGEKQDEPAAKASEGPAAASVSDKPRDGESPMDILARKLSMQSDDNKATESTTEDTAKVSSSLTDFVEEEGDVDNKYRLRKLLQQCSIEEIRSVAIPRALDVISLGDFFLYKAGQMSSKKVSYTSLYKQLEGLHSAISKESQRYTTLLRRANKVGGDRRMDKVILMPVYNKQAADALQVNSSSIDAHIGGIQQHATAQMIAANSFRMNCKMDPPLHRLELPDLTDKKQFRKNKVRPEDTSTTNNQDRNMYGQQQQQQQHNNSWQGRPGYTGPSVRGVGSYKGGRSNNYAPRKPNYVFSPSTQNQHRGVQPKSNPTTTSASLQEHARMQLASRHQSPFDAHRTTMTTPAVDTPVTAHVRGVTQMPDPTPTAVTSAESVMTSGETEQVMVDEQGTIVSAEEGKQLVSIGDGQYVELPEGYTLIQTDEGYIIGQPGATFVQGEDGNVYMTSAEDNAEISEQMLQTTTAEGGGEATSATAQDPLLEQLAQT